MVNNTGKEYLGDGVYIQFDGFHHILTTEDGQNVTNLIYLEPAVCDLLIKYLNRTVI